MILLNLIFLLILRILRLNLIGLNFCLFLLVNMVVILRIIKKSDLDFVVSKLSSGVSMSDLTRDFKYYDYYFECYSAVLSNFIGDFFC